MDLKSFPCRIAKVEFTDRLILSTIVICDDEIQYVNLALLLQILKEAYRIKRLSVDESLFSWLEDTDLNVSLNFHSGDGLLVLRFLSGSKELWKFDLEAELLGSDIAAVEELIANGA